MSENQVEIREVSIECKDAKVLIQELNQCLKQITGNDGSSHFQKQDVAGERGSFFIAYKEKEPYGCGAIREISKECAEIKRVYARKNSVGIGSKIVHALEEKAKDFGYHTILLETRVENIRAVRFYEGLGYEHCENYGVYQGVIGASCFKKEL